MQHPENDPTAVEPDDIAQPSPEVEQTVPKDYEPQPELQDGQSGEIVERDADLVADTEGAEDVADPTEGVADDDEADDDADGADDDSDDN